jgi:hypothetical protein
MAASTPSPTAATSTPSSGQQPPSPNAAISTRARGNGDGDLLRRRSPSASTVQRRTRAKGPDLRRRRRRRTVQWQAAGRRGPQCCFLGLFFEKTKSHPRVLSHLSVKPSPSVRFPALGEGGFPVERFPGLSSPRVALGEGFPECNWSIPKCILHPGKALSPVVSYKPVRVRFLHQHERCTRGGAQARVTIYRVCTLACLYATH